MKFCRNFYKKYFKVENVANEIFSRTKLTKLPKLEKRDEQKKFSRAFMQRELHTDEK